MSWGIGWIFKMDAVVPSTPAGEAPPVSRNPVSSTQIPLAQQLSLGLVPVLNLSSDSKLIVVDGSGGGRSVEGGENRPFPVLPVQVFTATWINYSAHQMAHTELDKRTEFVKIFCKNPGDTEWINFWAQKNILASCSSVLRKMLQIRGDDRPLVFRNVPVATVFQVLLYTHQGKLTASMDHLKRFEAVLHQLQVGRNWRNEYSWELEEMWIWSSEEQTTKVTVRTPWKSTPVCEKCDGITEDKENNQELYEKWMAGGGCKHVRRPSKKRFKGSSGPAETRLRITRTLQDLAEGVEEDRTCCRCGRCFPSKGLLREHFNQVHIPQT